MLSSISWQQYILFLVIGITLYYLIIWVVYFKAKLPVLSGRGIFRPSTRLDEDQPEDLISTSRHVMDELRPVFSHRYSKNELVMALQKKLQRYNQWDEPGFRDTVNAFIARESETTCSIHLGEEDLRELWMG